MFTVCPKCALTLVVTAQDLRVAQGYVRCGRCSNVFNAIVGLTDDRGALTNPGASGPSAGGQAGTATTSIIRKAPSISDDELDAGSPDAGSLGAGSLGAGSPAAGSPAAGSTGDGQDSLADTGETEAVYAEPDAAEVKFQEVFIEPPPPPSTPTRGPVKFVAPPPGPPPRAQEPPQRTFDAEKRYSDTEGIETYPENELEFNPDVTDVTKVFVEAAPVTFRNNAATGQFEKIVLGSDGELLRPTPPPANRNPAANANSAPPPASTPAPAPVRASAPARAAAPARPSPPPTPAPPANTAAPAARAPTPQPQNAPQKVEVTASRPAPKFQPAANDEAIASEGGATASTSSRASGTGSFARTTRFTDDEDEDEDDVAIGDIYAKAKPRPPAPRAATMSLPNDAEMEVGAIESIAPAAKPRSRYFPLWVAGASVLAVGLIVQAINHNRHDLATNAFLNRPLTKIYGALGIPLVPNWDLTKYDVRQLGASTSEASQGTLTVRASLKNTSDQPLPLPLLRIVMQDRYGNRVATRDVPPTGYVPGAVPAEAHLGVGQRLDAEMTFKDPGQDAVGFEIDACLPTATGRIACANDQAVAAR